MPDEMQLLEACIDQARDVTAKVLVELAVATKANAPFNSAHEGYSVILEELDELWDEVKKKSSKRDYHLMAKECIQIAAMAIRFILDVCEESEPEED